MDSSQCASPTWANRQLSLCCFAFRDVPVPPHIGFDRQVHGRESVRVDCDFRGTWPSGPSEGDAIWTASPDLPVAVRVADCVPILLWAPKTRAVAAVHAGWRGTAADILGATLDFARESFGVRPDEVWAAVGPCISHDRFEVGPEVVQALMQTGLTREDLRVHVGARGKPHVDLRAANRALLVRAGVPVGQIEDVGGCTWSEPERYDSYRRDGAASGRMHAVIALAQETP